MKQNIIRDFQTTYQTIEKIITKEQQRAKATFLSKISIKTSALKYKLFYSFFVFLFPFILARLGTLQKKKKKRTVMKKKFP